MLTSRFTAISHLVRAYLTAAHTAESNLTGVAERTSHAGSATYGARALHATTSTCAWISLCHGPGSRFLAAPTTGWQLSTGGPDPGGHGTTHIAIGPTAQGLGSVIIRHVLDQLILAGKEAGRLYHLEKHSDTAARQAEMRPLHVHVHRALIISWVSLLKAMTLQPEGVVFQRDSHRSGRCHYSHEGLPDATDRHLSAASESTRRKPAKGHPSVFLRHGRQA